jgi:hypothetical protein
MQSRAHRFWSWLLVLVVRHVIFAGYVIFRVDRAKVRFLPVVEVVGGAVGALQRGEQRLGGPAGRALDVLELGEEDRQAEVFDELGQAGALSECFDLDELGLPVGAGGGGEELANTGPGGSVNDAALVASAGLLALGVLTRVLMRRRGIANLR